MPQLPRVLLCRCVQHEEDAEVVDEAFRAYPFRQVGDLRASLVGVACGEAYQACAASDEDCDAGCGAGCGVGAASDVDYGAGAAFGAEDGVDAGEAGASRQPVELSWQP